MEFVYYGPLPPSLVRQVFEGEAARHHGVDVPAAVARGAAGARRLTGAASQRVEVFAQLGRDQAQTIQFAMQALRIGGRCLRVMLAGDERDRRL